ncbi:MAG TPA: lipid II flippase MurJ [Natronosporangium sp.]|nr:lipid II flippase MurJ [Natronosporangium sp.]
MRPHRIAGAAALIAVLTIVARVAGFGRTMVFAWAVGDTDLGDTYVVANTIPNIIFEIVAGGALASLVVPLLAPAMVAGDRAAVARTASVLLAWVLAGLVPLAVALALAARPVIELIATDPGPAQVAAGTTMLQIFAPQLPLYGVAIVLTGVLQAHRRFAWPVLAPLLSSVTVAAAYLLFAYVGPRGVGVAEVGTGGLLVLAVGTTAGVLVLTGCLVPQVARLGLRPVAGWRLPAGDRRRVRDLAVAGAVTLGAQNLALLVVLWRAWAGPEGTSVLFLLAQTIFLVPWAVLAVPSATAAYPTMAESAASGDHANFRATLAATTRATVLLCLLGAAALAGLAGPVAALIADLMPTARDSAAPLAAGLTGFAPGLVGYGLFAVLSRALYARGEAIAAAVAAAVGWATVAATAVALSQALPPDQRVLALTAANSVGMTVLGAGLLWAVVRRAGRAALAGLVRTAAAGVAAAVAAVVSGRVVLGAAPHDGPPAAAVSAGWGMLAGVVVGVVFAVTAWLLDRDQVGPLAAAVVRRRRRLDGGEEETRG